MYKINLIIFVLIQFTFLSCNSTQNDHISSDKSQTFRNVNFADLKEIFSSKSKGVYLSYDTLNHDLGTIILIDLISKKSIKLYDNTFYNSNPIFFENGTKILFASAQVGYLSQLRLTKYHAWRQLYLLDSDDLSITPFFYDNVEDDYDIKKYNCLSWDSLRNKIYFSNEDNKIFSLSVEDKQPKLLYALDKKERIWNLDLSPNKNYIAFDHDNFDTDYSCLSIYDISLDSVTIEMKSKTNFIRFLGWSFDNDIFYRSDSIIYQLNLNSNNPQKFDPKLTMEDYFVLKIFPESDQTAILLVDKLKYNPKIKYKVTTSTEIARYNFHSQKIEWITNDGSQKGDLNLLIN